MSFLVALLNWRASALHLRNLLQRLPPTSLKGMELRALLFTSDGSSTATLCQVLTELGMQAEICAERVTAIPRIASENYDAIIVDWDLEEDAKLLLKSARTQKAQGLNLALVRDDAAVARALQHGANSVIKKPIDANEARETLSTARDLILSRHTEQREKSIRLAAAPVETKSAENPVREPASEPKSGFTPQSMMRSAFEAEEKMSKPENSGGLGWQAARGPASLEKQDTELREVQPVTQKRWDEVKTIFRESPEEPQAEIPEVQKTQGSQDGTGVFSSLPEETEAAPVEESSSAPRYLVLAMVACCLVAAALYVWAPGDSYRGRLNAIFHLLSTKSKQPSDAPPAAAPTVSNEKPSGPAPAKATEQMVQDAAPVDSTDVDPSKIQIIAKVRASVHPDRTMARSRLRQVLTFYNIADHYRDMLKASGYPHSGKLASSVGRQSRRHYPGQLEKYARALNGERP